MAQGGGGGLAQRGLPRGQRGQEQGEVRGRRHRVRREEDEHLRVQHPLQLPRKRSLTAIPGRLQKRLSSRHSKLRGTA